MFIQAHGWDVDKREMIGCENVLLFPIKFSPELNFGGYANEKEQCFRPPPIEYTHQVKLFFKKNRNKKREEKDDKENTKNQHSIDCINFSQIEHGIELNAVNDFG